MAENDNMDFREETGTNSTETVDFRETAQTTYAEPVVSESIANSSLSKDELKEMERIEQSQKTKGRPSKVTIQKADGSTVEVKVKGKKIYKPEDILFYVLDYSFYIIFTIACLFPFYYLFINTISGSEYVARGEINFLPKALTLQNYVALKNVSDLGRSVIVTVIRTVLGTALMVAASGFVGFLVTKEEMWHRKFFYRFLVITMYFNAGLIPWYLNMLMLGLTDHFAAYIIPGIVAPYNIILVKTYIESIPGELQESAFMDGASYMTVFTKIIWPLSKPILATIAIFGAVGNWNSFQDSLILMPNAVELHTLQHKLYVYLNQSTNLSAVMNSGGGSTAALNFATNGKIVKYTISMVSIIPILCVYPFMQRYFEEGIMLGAVKG